MLVEKEVISPGKYWYIDEKTGLPRVLDVDSSLTKHWHTEGSKMLSSGLQVPVPYEHDFSAHPMTPREKLLNNAGEVREYKIKDFNDPQRGLVKDALFAVCDIQDPEVKNKIGHSIRWTSPWFNSFVDGDGKQWNNVIAHLALTTRPRITKQSPFPHQAALSIASSPQVTNTFLPQGGLCVSRAGLLKEGEPFYPIAFSLYSGVGFSNEQRDKDGKFASKGSKGKKGRKSKEEEEHEKEHNEAVEHHSFVGDYIRSIPARLLRATEHSIVRAGAKAIGLSTNEPISAMFGEMPPGLKKDKSKTPKPGAESGAEEGGETPEDSAPPGDAPGAEVPGDPGKDIPALGDQPGDVSMEEVLCDLLRALGVDCEHSGDEGQFKRNLYSAAMQKVHELTNKGMNKDEELKPGAINKDKPPGSNPQGQQNPLVQQEQQPMYMSHTMNTTLSLEDINKISDPTMRTIALSMHAENKALREQMESNARTANSLATRTLQEATAKRNERLVMLGKLSPKTKKDLEVMIALPSMALSLGDGGVVVDPMAQTLALLEKTVSNLPLLLTTETASLAVQSHPTDNNEMTEEESDRLADIYAKRMGAPPVSQKKAS